MKEFIDIIAGLLGIGGQFGFSPLMPAPQTALGLVGTMVEIKDIKYEPSGAMQVQVQGLHRYFVRKFLKVSPYYKAAVQVFHDYSASSMETLEKQYQYLFYLYKLFVKVRSISFLNQ